MRRILKGLSAIVLFGLAGNSIVFAKTGTWYVVFEELTRQCATLEGEVGITTFCVFQPFSNCTYNNDCI